MDPKRIPDEMPDHGERERSTEKPISGKVYPVIDTDLGRDNVENDLTEADRQDL